MWGCNRRTLKIGRVAKVTNAKFRGIGEKRCGPFGEIWQKGGTG